VKAKAEATGKKTQVNKGREQSQRQGDTKSSDHSWWWCQL